MSTPPEQMDPQTPRRRTSVGEVLFTVAQSKGGTDPRMARILASEERRFRQRQQQAVSQPVADVQDAPPPDSRMQRKLDFEEQRFRERSGNEQRIAQPPSPPQRPRNDAPLQPPITAQSGRKERVEASKKVISSLAQRFGDEEKKLFPSGATKALQKSTHRTIGGNGPLFKGVLKGLALVEQAADEKNLQALDSAARAYLDDLARRANEAQSKGKSFKPDDVTTTKRDAARDALERVRKLRAMRALKDEASKLPGEAKTVEEEATVSRVRARMMVEAGGSRKLGVGESGASESFFLSDPTTGEKGYIFKPADGEFDAGYGWKKGGGAPREVVLSSINEAFKNTLGLDCGVSTTTLVKVDSPSIATERNGGKSARVGAIQNFVKSDGNMQTKIDDDPTFLSKVRAEDIEKIALLDFATLQMDRQASNLLVKDNSDGTASLVPIDAGNALPSRKAFEASRRMFGNNALLGGAEARKPFSPQMQQQIQAMDADEIVRAMRKSNQDMAAIDPQAGTAVDEENLEITRRSILFLKKAAAKLTKAEIADAYAYEFHQVLDAKPAAVEGAIDAAIQAVLDKPGVLDEITKLGDAKKLFTELGWPNSEFETLRAENPARLLDILRKKTPCQATLNDINEVIEALGRDKFKPDPDTIPAIDKRWIEVRNVREQARKARLLNDPKAQEKAASVGADLYVIHPKTKERALMNDTVRVDFLERIENYIAADGDADLRRRGIDPSKLSFEQRYYEQLGGDKLLKELEQRGLNPYMDEKLQHRITDLLAYQEYVKLGGDDAYVGLGCPQNKDVTLSNRIDFMRTKLKLRG